jgi:hypothetical protein
MDRRDWERDRTRLDVHPADDPDVVAPPVADPLVEDEFVDPDRRRVKVVRVVNTVINLVCGLFAIVLALHIILVLAEANPNNGFASLVDSWSSAVSLGLRGLFTPENEKLQVLLNDGLAALGWLVIAGVLTYAIRQFALPGPGRAAHYRRRRVVR